MTQRGQGERVLGGCEPERARERVLKVSEDGIGCKRQTEKERRGGRRNEEKRPEPNWFVMPDMPVTVLTRTASRLPPAPILPGS